MQGEEHVTRTVGTLHCMSSFRGMTAILACSLVGGSFDGPNLFLSWLDSITGDGMAQKFQLLLEKLTFGPLDMKTILAKPIKYTSKVFLVFSSCAAGHHMLSI